jgi:hypothetical protein
MQMIKVCILSHTVLFRLFSRSIGLDPVVERRGVWYRVRRWKVSPGATTKLIQRFTGPAPTTGVRTRVTLRWCQRSWHSTSMRSCQEQRLGRIFTTTCYQTVSDPLLWLGSHQCALRCVGLTPLVLLHRQRLSPVSRQQPICLCAAHVGCTLRDESLSSPDGRDGPETSAECDGADEQAWQPSVPYCGRWPGQHRATWRYCDSQSRHVGCIIDGQWRAHCTKGTRGGSCAV